MNRLQKYFGVFLAGLFLNTLLGCASVSASSETEIPPAASVPRESCSLGFSCQSTSCRGGSVIGLCSNKLSSGYTLRLRGKIPDSINLFASKFNGIPVEQTKLVLRIIDDNKKPFIDMVITKETIGFGLVGEVDTKNFVDSKRISKGISIDRTPSNFRVESGDDFDYYLYYNNSYLTFLFKHKDGKYYEVGSLYILNKAISSIVPLTGPMDYNIHFEQTMTLTAPKTFVQHTMPGNPSSQVYSGPFSLRRGTEVVYPGGNIFEDGVKIVINQGEITSNKVKHTFIKYNDSKIQLTISITYSGNNKYKFLIQNAHKNENKEVNFDANSLKNHLNSGDIVHLGYFFTDGHLLICIGDTCFASTEIKGAQINKIRTTVWFTTSVMLSIPEQTLMGSAVGRYKCRVGETSCYGSEFRLQNPLSPGQKVEIQSLYDSGNYFNDYANISQKELFGAIAMGDAENMRAAVFLSVNSVSLVLFSESGILTDACSVYLSGNNVFNQKNEIKIIVGLSNNNKLGVSGYIGNKVLLFCDLNLGSISITRFRPVKDNVYSGSSKYTLSNDYPAEGYEGISGGSSTSRTQQQAANCYLATNGECNASQIVHMDGSGFVKGTYLTVKSSSVIFPFTFYVKSSDNNSDQFAFTVISTGKFSMRNVNTQDIIYAKIPPSCMERILHEGLSVLLSSDQSKIYASICGLLLGSVPSTSLNKKLKFIFHKNMSGNSVRVATFPVFGGGSVALEYTSEKYSTNSDNIKKDDDLTFHSPCDARKSVSTSLDNCSSLINMSTNRLTNGYSIMITGTVEKPSSNLEQAFNIGIPIENAIQVFNLKASNGRTILQFFITEDQLGLSIHNPLAITRNNGHVGAPIPSSVNLEEGSKYRIGIGFKDSAINLLIENPYGSGKFAMLRRNLVSVISAWGETAYNRDFTKYEPINSIVPELLVKSPYSYSLSNNVNTWFPVSKEFYAPRSGDNSCTLSIYGVCTTSKVYMPGNKPVNNDAKFFIRFYSFQKNTFSLSFKREDGTIVAQLEFSSTSTLWSGSVTIKFTTRFERSTDTYSVYNFGSKEFIIQFVGNAIGYHLDGQWKVLLALENKDNFNQVLVSQLDGFVIEYVKTDSSNPAPWQYIKYGSTTAKASMVLAYNLCNAQNPTYGYFSTPGVYLPASSIENLCSTSLHPNHFSLVFKSRYPNYVKDEVAKTFPNFPGFLHSIVLLYNGSVVYTLVIARKYISFFSSLYSGEAGTFSSCSSQVPDEAEFQPGSKYYITFFVDGSDLHVYFHSYVVGKSALLCKLPYNQHFNAAKTFGQVFIDSSQTTAAIVYGLKRTLYTPNLNASNLYPMGTVVSKNAILSSGMPFSPNESLSIEMTCGKDLIFSGQTGKPQLRLKTNGSSFTLENVPGKINATGTLSGGCVCSTNKKIVVNLAYVNNQFRLIACKVSAASIFTTGVSIYQISSEVELSVTYRTDLRLASATSLTSSQISKVEEQPDTSKDEENIANSGKYIPESFSVQATLHVIPKYSTS
ncbi:hypothetical protein [Cryptosporidium parvum Iowa II]|uniref:Uncharacterized protein n=1 Tax=Cryptosporidium parvum (strain Iowa II) TaxID=353152 RepID=Q5CUC6_CRYPI|nr:hypothetical protein [Cryptosporidium parvum Iowa II]EAK89002.1 large hypothetical protein with signal peptide [Cryptosporidium parvum Iowa II]WKS77086.1 signal peptide-containing protein [Cryptosporidium sp. 43IA8]